MQFHHYKSFWGQKEIEAFLEDLTRHGSYEEIRDPQTNHARAELAWIHDRRPFYRFWPGLFYAFSKVDLSQIRIRNLQFTLPDDLHSIVIEFPKDVPYETYGIESAVMVDDHELHGQALTSLLIYQATPETMKGMGKVEFHDTLEKIYFCIMCELDEKGVRCHRNGIMFDKAETDLTVGEYLNSRKGLTRRDVECLRFSARILILLALLSSDDEKLFQRLVLDRDRNKFDRENAEKFWDRAKRNGRYGWDVGKDIPTPEELEEYKASGMLRGKVVPHVRSGHFSTRLTGQGRTIKKLVWIDETVVNKHLAKKIPEGYYGENDPGMKDE